MNLKNKTKPARPNGQYDLFNSIYLHWHYRSNGVEERTLNGRQSCLFTSSVTGWRALCGRQMQWTAWAHTQWRLAKQKKCRMLNNNMMNMPMASVHDAGGRCSPIDGGGDSKISFGFTQEQVECVCEVSHFESNFIYTCKKSTSL